MTLKKNVILACLKLPFNFKIDCNSIFLQNNKIYNNQMTKTIYSTLMFSDEMRCRYVYACMYVNCVKRNSKAQSKHFIDTGALKMIATQ